MRERDLSVGVVAAVAERLAPFGPYETEPREVICECIAKRAREIVDNESWTRFSQEPVIALPDGKTLAECSDEESAEIARSWIEQDAERQRWLAKRITELRPDPDPECFCCHGKGTRSTRSNPKQQFDGYDIGGRWLGLFNDYDLGDAEPVACTRCGGTGHVAEFEFCGHCSGGKVPRNPDALVRASVAPAARALETLATIVPALVIDIDGSLVTQQEEYLSLAIGIVRYGETHDQWCERVRALIAAGEVVVQVDLHA